eukprot:CAMPEP_0196571090 /NCGR_PEP_ID=MMETSP1081-20130531/1251_1 /TAXON_ID=36882 /ORGANISM="Pyramimonas amylifera, Strain CCMP720" /LENGTH=72 /DNA_ID=CAMNT_0041887861 /DNA_START=447 /DNA_END=665 /DNA_ORIENTATION=-
MQEVFNVYISPISFFLNGADLIRVGCVHIADEIVPSVLRRRVILEALAGLRLKVNVLVGGQQVHKVLKGLGP